MAIAGPGRSSRSPGSPTSSEGRPADGGLFRWGFHLRIKISSSLCATLGRYVNGEGVKVFSSSLPHRVPLYRPRSMDKLCPRLTWCDRVVLPPRLPFPHYPGRDILFTVRLEDVPTPDVRQHRPSDPVWSHRNYAVVRAIHTAHRHFLNFIYFKPILAPLIP
jgi:hypothetical protein